MHPTCTLSKEDQGFKVDQKLYRGMIGSLLYLTASRPDILFSVSLCARFQSEPRETHLTAIKRIFRYMKGTTNLGLLYKKSLDYKLVGFCDADYAGDRIEWKWTSGNCQFLGENLISWASKRQATKTFKFINLSAYSLWNQNSFLSNWKPRTPKTFKFINCFLKFKANFRLKQFQC